MLLKISDAGYNISRKANVLIAICLRDGLPNGASDNVDDRLNILTLPISVDDVGDVLKKYILI
jgi:hypothetical protein